MRKIAVVLLAGILLCLGGCAKEPVISGIPVAERLYSVYNGSATKIVDGTGKVVLQGEYPNTTLIRDELTKEPLYIVMVKITQGQNATSMGNPSDTRIRRLFTMPTENYCMITGKLPTGPLLGIIFLFIAIVQTAVW